MLGVRITAHDLHIATDALRRRVPATLRSQNLYLCLLDQACAYDATDSAPKRVPVESD